jgi:predicted site-specific integrase-resolvase
MKAAKVLQILGVTRVTLMNYVKQKKIIVTKLHNGRYDYDDNSVWKLAGKRKRKNFIYARVSTNKQKNDLQTQIKYIQNYCKKNKIIIDKTYSEIASGIHFERKQFSDLLNEVFSGSVENIIISHKDRLTRMSFMTLSAMFEKFNTKIIVVSAKRHKSNDSDIFEELISMMHYFSTKMYSNRRKKKIIHIKDTLTYIK